jgi:hypothetical protein
MSTFLVIPAKAGIHLPSFRPAQRPSCKPIIQVMDSRLRGNDDVCGLGGDMMGRHYSPLPQAGGVVRLGSLLLSRSGVGILRHAQCHADRPHPNPSPEGEGLTP